MRKTLRRVIRLSGGGQIIGAAHLGTHKLDKRMFFESIPITPFATSADR